MTSARGVQTGRFLSFGPSNTPFVPFSFLSSADLQSCTRAYALVGLSDIATACRRPSIGKQVVALCRDPLGVHGGGTGSKQTPKPTTIATGASLPGPASVHQQGLLPV